jgi:hypothetical protein
MSTMVTELYQALRAAGVDDGLAKAAAESVLSKDRKEDLATKAQVPFIDRVNDHIAGSARWVGPILIVLGLAGAVAALIIHLCR